MTGRRRWDRAGIVALTAMLSAATAGSAPAADRAAEARVARLAKVQSWTYQLQQLDDAKLHQQATDLVVIDYSHDGSEPRELWPVQVARFKQKPGGGRRIVLAYMSIGEAEDYRFYWLADWDVRRPAWFMAETCKWPGNHVVHYWRPDWKQLIYAGPFSYLARIQHAGFDGVYLDRIDAYQQLAPQFPKARAEMVAVVRGLAESAHARDPGFLVVAQNAEEMLTDRSYRSAIDGVAKEDLLFGLGGEGVRNPVSDVRASVEFLRRLTADRKPVLAVEYLTAAGPIEQAARELRRLGFVPTFTARQLDGGAGLPFAPAPAPAPTGAQAAAPCQPG